MSAEARQWAAVSDLTRDSRGTIERGKDARDPLGIGLEESRWRGATSDSDTVWDEQ
jgi:hypothetical protein